MNAEDDELRLQLMALADGEPVAAGAAEALRAEARLDAARWLQEQQQLTFAARRALRADSAAPSASLRESVERQLGGSTWSNVFLTISKYAVAAMVLLAIGAMAGRMLFRAPGVGSTVAVAPTLVIPASIIAHASLIHVDCSRVAAALHSAAFPEPQGPLAQAVRHDLHSDQPYPDLRPAGFRYVGAGPCAAPLAGTIHLLYHALRAGSLHTVSLFVQPDTGQFPLQPERLYTVSSAVSPFPMIAWRTDAVVYFLLADSEATESSVLSLLQSSHAAPTATAPGSK